LAQRVVAGLDQFRKPHRKRHAFAYLLVVGACNGGCLAFLLQLTQQRVETLLQKPLPERRIVPRPGQLCLGDRRESTRQSALATSILNIQGGSVAQINNGRLSLGYHALLP
jgi:hypothetical protein